LFLQQKSKQYSRQRKPEVKLQPRVQMQGKMLTLLEIKRYHQLSAHILHALTILKDSHNHSSVQNQAFPNCTQSKI